MARVHPALKKMLVAPKGSTVEVVLQLKGSHGRAVDDPETTRRLATEVLHRVGSITSENPEDYHVFANLQSFVVRASVPFVRTLIKQPEVAAAVPNRQK